MNLSWPPNWKNANEYPDLSGATGKRVAWEFLRRNPKYLAAWEHYKQTREELDHQALYKELGVGNLADPATEWVNDGIWIPDGPTTWRALAWEQFSSVVVTTHQDRVACKKGYGMSPEEFYAAIQPQSLEEVVVKFNLLNS
ncbi:MAG TPA: DUF6499 domain-containing protein, partial [Candidatus Saccharimonadales bacterium]